MTDIDISAKTDRELLIMVVDKLNTMCNRVDKHDKALYNNGYGALFQIRMLWTLALGAWALILVYFKKYV